MKKMFVLQKFETTAFFMMSCYCTSVHKLWIQVFDHEILNVV